MEKTKTIARVNNVDILVIENGEKRVAIKPICEALEIDFSRQLQKVKEDEILGSVVGLTPTTGRDGKTYEMQTIPFMFVFGWLFTINPKNVKPEAQEAVSRYRLECYKALFHHFTDQSEFLEHKQTALESQIEEVQRIRTDFNHTKKRLKEANIKLNQIKELSFENWKVNNSQMKIEFE